MDETPAPAQPAAPVPDERLPERLGDFEVRGLLGRGGMGRVLLGHDPSLDRPVAIKELLPSLAGKQDLLQRFLREARLLGRLSHENICAVHFLGQDKATGAPFFVMEYLEGETAGHLLERQGPLPVARALAVARQTALALRSALAQGMIHRDVKPSNLMITRGGDVKVTDFGLVKLLEESSGITASGTYLGTPQYVSPEEGRGQPCDHRADIYSLGATLFCLLAGRPPFQGPGPLSVVYQHCYEPPPDVRSLRPDVPAAVARLVGRMLEKEPARRHASYDELLAELDPLLEAARSGATEPAARAALRSLAGLFAPGVSAAPAVRAASRRRVALAVGAAAALVAGLVAAGLPRWLFRSAAAGPHVRRPATLGAVRLVLLPRGEFMMGSAPGEPGRSPSEAPARRTTLAYGVWMSDTEVTKAAYRDVTGNNPSVFDVDERTAPVDSVTWEEARDFAARLTERERAAGALPDGLVFRLPTEAEWEYACRAGTTTPWNVGPTLGPTQANFRSPPPGVRPDEFTPTPVPVRSYPPNAFGLREMHGNLREWCLDGVREGRALRGGCFADRAEDCRSASRTELGQGVADRRCGFRVVLAPPAP